ncbi:MAG: hypothetical protein ACRDY2_03815 [Acidimicrobiales bacterium]
MSASVAPGKERPTVGALFFVRAMVGVLNLLAPGLVAGRLVEGQLSRRARRVVQVLGARQVLQALLTGRKSSRAVLGLGAEVDATHAISMVALALIDRHYRRAGLADALVAAGFAVAGASGARKADPRPTAGPRLVELRNAVADRLARLLLPGYPPASREKLSDASIGV